MDVVIGTYDSAVVGYRLMRSSDKSQIKFNQRFSDASQKGCIKCLTISSKGILASGSSDETVHILDLERGTDVGSLVSHEGDVTGVQFVGKDFLYTCSADGTLRMWRARIWELQRSFKGHKGTVLSFDIHPSKKLALSVGTDKKLIVWDLVAGKYSFIRNMKKICEIVKFSPSGSFYAIKTGNILELFDLSTAESTHLFELASHIGNFSFLSDDVIMCATDSGKISLLSATGKKVVMEFEAHSNRIRATEGMLSSDPNVACIISCSSDHTIKAWRLEIAKKTQKLLASVDTGCRITCLAIRSSPDTVRDIVREQPPVAVVEKEKSEPIIPAPLKSVVVSKNKKKKKASNSTMDVRKRIKT